MKLINNIDLINILFQEGESFAYFPTNISCTGKKIDQLIFVNSDIAGYGSMIMVSSYLTLVSKDDKVICNNVPLSAFSAEFAYNRQIEINEEINFEKSFIRISAKIKLPKAFFMQVFVIYDSVEDANPICTGTKTIHIPGLYAGTLQQFLDTDKYGRLFRIEVLKKLDEETVKKLDSIYLTIYDKDGRTFEMTPHLLRRAYNLCDYTYQDKLKILHDEVYRTPVDFNFNYINVDWQRSYISNILENDLDLTLYFNNNFSQWR